MTRIWDYSIETVHSVASVAEILRFYRRRKAPGVRRIGKAEVTKLVEARTFFVAREGKHGRIAGTVYFSAQGLKRSRSEFEMGGGLMAARHRRTGLVKCLGVCGLVAFRMSVQRSPTDPGTDVTIVGRVEKSNPSPVRRVLRGLGFRSVGVRRINPRSKRGLDRMPIGPDGRIVVSQYRFNETKLLDRIREAGAYRDSGVLGGSGKTVHVAIRELTVQDPLQDFLHGLRDQVARSHRANGR